MKEREIQYITVGGKQLLASAAICPICKTLDLNTDFDTSTQPWKARCPMEHEWEVNANAN